MQQPVCSLAARVQARKLGRESQLCFPTCVLVGGLGTDILLRWLVWLRLKKTGWEGKENLMDNYCQAHCQVEPKNHDICPNVQRAHKFFLLEMHLNAGSHGLSNGIC